MTNPRIPIAPLLPAARSGCSESLGLLLQACQRYLLSVARREIDPGLIPKGGASDVVQETFLEAQRDFDQFRGVSEAELLAWLRKLLLNNLASFARRYRATARRSIRREVALGNGTMEADWLPETTRVSPEQLVVENEEVQYLRVLITRLPVDYARILTLWYEEHSFEEIGVSMERSTNAARMLWMRAIERLRELVDESHSS